VTSLSRNLSAGVRDLVATGEIGDRGDGRLLLSGRALDLVRWIDARLEALAIADGARPLRVPATIARATLDRAGHLEAFPRLAAALVSTPSRGEFLLAPAVCYHVYDRLAGSAADPPLTFTAVGTCVRQEAAGAVSLSRLWEFTMREVIFVGAAVWVRDARQRWMQRVTDLAVSLGLTGVMQPATDPFFTSEARGMSLIQQLKELKHEYRMDVGVGDAAVPIASFNLHEAYFGERFGIRAGEATAHSSCVAFGLERWLLAMVTRLGADGAAALTRGA
jgi:hypothetical protein